MVSIINLTFGFGDKAILMMMERIIELFMKVNIFQPENQKK